MKVIEFLSQPAQRFMVVGILNGEEVRGGTSAKTGKPYVMHTLKVGAYGTMLDVSLPTEDGATEKTVKRTGIPEGSKVGVLSHGVPEKDKYGVRLRAISCVRLEA